VGPFIIPAKVARTTNVNENTPEYSKPDPFGRLIPEPAPILAGGEEQWVVEKILKKERRGRRLGSPHVSPHLTPTHIFKAIILHHDHLSYYI